MELFAWETDMMILPEFILMIICTKIFYRIYDFISSMLVGNYYKYAANMTTSCLYKKKVSFDEAIAYDNAPIDIINKRKESLDLLEKRFAKFDYKSVSNRYTIHSTDGKINPKIGMYIPFVFGSIAEKYSFHAPCLFKCFDVKTGCKLVDIKNNYLFDLSSGNGVNIIGNKKISQLTRQSVKSIGKSSSSSGNNSNRGEIAGHAVGNGVVGVEESELCEDLPFQVGLSSIHTVHAINNILEICNKNVNAGVAGSRRYDCVSFMESGSAAVHACIKQARFHHNTFGNVERKRIVLFRNTYHGWIINPYINESNPDPNVVILDALSIESLAYIVNNYLKIAAVFIDPMKLLSVNDVYPRETLTVASRVSAFGKNTESLTDQYVKFMRKVGEICKEYNILYVLDECYSGFRVGPYGAFNLYKLNPDMIIFSKQIGCGLNTTAVVGTKHVMQRKKGAWETLDGMETTPEVAGNRNDGRKSAKSSVSTGGVQGGGSKHNALVVGAAGGPTAEVVFVTGTGSTNPQHHKMVRKFTNYALSEEYGTIHSSKMKMFNDWCLQVNTEFKNLNLPIRLNNYFNTFSFDLLSDSFYNWMFCVKLVSHNIVFTPGGTTKFTLSFDYTPDLLDDLLKIFIKAGKEMQNEGWFYQASQDTSNAAVKKQKVKSNKLRVLQTTLLHNLYTYIYLFFDTIRIDKIIDVGCSHNHPVNRFTHFWSSLLQLCISYPMWYYNYKFEAMLTFLLFHVFRQSGHFFYEAQLKHDEKVKIGYKNATKKRFAVGIPLAIAIFIVLEYFYPVHFDFKKLFVLLGLFSVVNRFVDISECHGWVRAISWFTKIATDVVTDLYDMADCWNPLQIKQDAWQIDWKKIRQNQSDSSFSLVF